MNVVNAEKTRCLVSSRVMGRDCFEFDMCTMFTEMWQNEPTCIHVLEFFKPRKSHPGCPLLCDNLGF